MRLKIKNGSAGESKQQFTLNCTKWSPRDTWQQNMVTSAQDTEARMFVLALTCSNLPGLPARASPFSSKSKSVLVTWDVLWDNFIKQRPVKHRRLRRLHVCCGFSDLHSVQISETVTVICSYGLYVLNKSSFQSKSRAWSLWAKFRGLRTVTTVLQKINGDNMLSRINCLYDEVTFGKSLIWASSNIRVVLALSTIKFNFLGKLSM
jgi:hypothetical protein